MAASSRPRPLRCFLLEVANVTSSRNWWSGCSRKVAPQTSSSLCGSPSHNPIETVFLKFHAGSNGPRSVLLMQAFHNLGWKCWRYSISKAFISFAVWIGAPRNLWTLSFSSAATRLRVVRLFGVGESESHVRSASSSSRSGEQGPLSLGGVDLALHQEVGDGGLPLVRKKVCSSCLHGTCGAWEVPELLELLGPGFKHGRSPYSLEWFLGLATA
mmetsp:Transcript_47347/g.84695  ORF Transcript_47347/g.84695 Transcript_47347/m.84695 type:complete len:214 (+) Transcript_47347:758-1399(+)